MALESSLQKQAPRVLSLVRLVAGLIFMEHGTQKLLGFPPGEHSGAQMMTLIW